MLIEIRNIDILPEIFPGFVRESFRRLIVEAKKLGDKYYVSKSEIVKSMEKRRHAFVESARFVDGVKSFMGIEMTENDFNIVQE